MTSDQIKCFCKVAEVESFTKAAELLYINQSSVSKKINALEKELELQLFVRDKSSRTRLTASGRELYEGFQRLGQDFERIYQQAKLVAAGSAGKIRIGYFENQMVDEYMQTMLDSYAASYPNVDIHLTTDTFHGLIDDVENHRIDCAITLGYDLIGRTGLEHRFLYELPSSLVVPNHMLKEKKESYVLADFGDFPFLTISEDNNQFQHRMISAQLREVGITPILIEATDDKHFNSLLEMGRGIAVLDIYNKGQNARNVTSISVPEIGNAPFELVWVNSNQNPALHSFLDYLACKGIG